MLHKVFVIIFVSILYHVSSGDEYKKPCQGHVYVLSTLFALKIIRKNFIQNNELMVHVIFPGISLIRI